MSQMITALLLAIVGGGVIGGFMATTGLHPFLGIGACFLYGFILVPRIAEALHKQD